MSTRTLRILREVNNYTQEFVAEDILSISQNTYSRLEQNPSRITAEQARKLAALYKVSIADLLSDVTPTISFEDIGKEKNEGETTIFPQNQNINFDNATLIILKEQNELLIQQNAALIERLQSLKT